jgi:flagellar biosynthesis/type III secretory pathway protein FliH
MAKYQLHLSKPVRTVGKLSSLRVDSLAVCVQELPVREPVGDRSETANVREPSQHELQLQQQLEQLEQQVAAMVGKLGQKLDEVNAIFESEQSELKHLAVQLAMIATRTVLKQVTVETDQRLEKLIVDGLGEMPGTEAVTVRLHPAQCDRLAYHFDELASQRKLRFIADPSVASGEVILEHPLFSLSSNLSEQLKQMEQALHEEMLH